MVRGLDALHGIVAREAEDPAHSADAGTVAEEAIGLTLAANRADGGCVRFRVQAPTGIELPIPASRFREIVANLARNAAEACGGDGTVEVTLTSSLEAVVIEVRDDGSGLPAVTDEVLFRRGFSTKGTGRGRGLALVEESVRSAGGTLRLGRLERGTLARVVLPRGGNR
jgi:signal transduction histidine kinase